MPAALLPKGSISNRPSDDFRSSLRLRTDPSIDTIPAMRGLWIASRPLYLPGGVMLYVLGALLAGRRPALAALPTMLGAIVVVLVHVITHWVNDAEDVETDDRTSSPTPLTGGSRAIQRGLVTPAALLRASLVLSIAVVAIAAFELVIGDSIAAALHLAILVLGYSYSGRPFAFGRRGLGEIVTATVMGALVPIAGAHAAGAISAPVTAAATLLFVETIFARLCTAWPDLEADRATGKRTIPVLLGARRSALGFLGAGVATIAVAFHVAPMLPAPGWQRAGAVVVALLAFAVASVVASGRAPKRPIVVPILGVLAYGVGMSVLFAGSLLPR
jgi:1,4-dihydroxy-2-naphthoate octaprenyltransferase